jgi:hypothetical protein
MEILTFIFYQKPCELTNKINNLIILSCHNLINNKEYFMKKIFETKRVYLILFFLIVVGVGIYAAIPGFSKDKNALNLPVPFSPQAPNQNWDRNEDCEETSITMANAFLTGNHIAELPASAAQESINILKLWEGQNIGYNANTGTEATKAMAEGAFGLKVNVVENYTAEDLKEALKNNRPVLISINARKLGNPKYLDSGPLYHMVVVRGFEGDVFIVNDPGTNGGANNKYTFEVLKNAAADWDQASKTMLENQKIALVLSR